MGIWGVMMNAECDLNALLNHLSQKNIEIWLEGDKLKFKSPPQIMTDELKEQLRQSKNSLIKHLKNIQRNLYELSFSQERLWFLQQLDTTNVFYNIPLIAWLDGNLNIQALESAFNHILQRHEVLRAIFPKSNSGLPTLEIIDDFKIKLNPQNVPNEKKAFDIIKQYALQPFDILSKPLINIQLVSIGESRHLLLISMHHLLADGWALNILSNELTELYDALILGNEARLSPIQMHYYEYSKWQRHVVSTKKYQKQLQYWKTTLKDYSRLDFPTDYPRPTRNNFQGDMENFIFPTDLADEINDFASNQGVTVYTVMLAALNILLSRYTGKKDIIIATPVSNRSIPEVENLIGTFMNTLVLKTNLHDIDNFQQVLDATKQVTLDAFDNQDLPFEYLVEQLNPDRSLNNSPIFQFLFLYETGKSSLINLRGLKTTPVNLPLGTARFEIVFLLNTTERGLEGAIEYSTQLFKRETILNFIVHFRLLLEEIIKPQRKKLSCHFLMTDKEKQLYSYDIRNDTSCTLKSLPQLFNEIVLKHGHMPAIFSSGHCISFSELDILSNQLAYQLASMGINKDDRIGVYCNSSAFSMIAILSAIKFGGIFVALDPNYPIKRIEYLTKDAELKLIITEKKHIRKISHLTIDLIAVDDLDTTDEYSMVNGKTDSALYIMYTSGTTGDPKGVVIKHNSVLNLLDALEESIYQHNPSLNNVLVNGSLSFDTSIKQIIQLFKGRCIHMISNEIRYDGKRFIDYVIKHAIDVVDCTPSQLQLLIQSGLLSNKQPKKLIMLLGGEHINQQLWEVCAKNNSNIIFYNMYGPTECTVDASWCRIAGNIPTIGQPIKNQAIYILDHLQRPLPLGAVGEIYISGLGVAKGYWNNRQLTQEKFIKNPFDNTNQSFMYRTGDYGKYLDDGSIIFKGRKDEQIKIQGHRIETKEIVSVLEKYDDIDAALVIPSNDVKKKLIAYIKPSKTRAPSIDSMPRYQLPNGLAIAHLNKNETDFLYRDIFINLAYLRHGIKIYDNAVIFDVGANIGMFSLQASTCASHLKIHAFEPNPYIRKITNKNFNIYNIVGNVYEYAVSKCNESVSFQFYKHMSILSGIHANMIEEEKLLQSYIKKNDGVDINANTSLKQLVANRLESEVFNVKTIRLSDFFKKNNINKVDLLKINIEKAELEALEGIDDHDWSMIEQVVVEIHDFDNALEKVKSILTPHNFNIKIDKDWSLDESQNIYYLYATKSDTHNEIATKIVHPPIITVSEIKTFCETHLPRHMLPAEYVFIENFPLTYNGKIDHKKLLKIHQHQPCAESNNEVFKGDAEQTIHSIWCSLLGKNSISRNANFFDIGGHSLLLAVLHNELNKNFDTDITLVDLFEFTSIKSQATRIAKTHDIAPKKNRRAPTHNTSSKAKDIAIIGMAGKFPQSPNCDVFWENLMNNECMTTTFTDSELQQAGVAQTVIRDAQYIPVKGALDNIENFDAEFFSYNPREAELMDPQVRIMLECVQEALESSGIVTPVINERVGLFCGQSISTYLLNNILPTIKENDSIDAYQVMLSNDKDHLALQIAYRFNLRGPCISIQTACSTSLVAVHMACKAIQNGECDLALAGGVSITTPNASGYQYVEKGIFSPNGTCRPFDSNANGTVPGNGAGVVVLKDLESAMTDHDNILAVIKSTAINNDGNAKIGYTAPSINGQKEVIQNAIDDSDIDPITISYIEAHGTGTALGDPIELAALNRVFNKDTATNKVYIGSLKSNIGHLDAAAGVASLIKVILSLQHKTIPASIHFNAHTDKIDWRTSVFEVAAKNIPWLASDLPRRAGISSFGIGGTNAHVILEEAPAKCPYVEERDPSLFVLSAKSEQALRDICLKFENYLEETTNNMTDLCYTLQTKRSQYAYRVAIPFTDKNNLMKQLKKINSITYCSKSKASKVIVVFSQKNNLSPNYIFVLYQLFPEYQRIIENIQAAMSDLFEISPINLMSKREHNQYESLLFSFIAQYSLATFFKSMRIEPTLVANDFLGEVVAASLLGSIALSDALQLLGSFYSLPLRSHVKSQKINTIIQTAPPQAFWYSVTNDKKITTSIGMSSNYWRNFKVATTTQQLKIVPEAFIEHGLIVLLGNSTYTDSLHSLTRFTPDHAEQSNTNLLLDFYQLLATLWIYCGSLNFSVLHHGKSRYTVALPTYAFQRKHFWLRQKKKQEKNISVENKQQDQDIESRLRDIWISCLGVQDIDLDADFFELGGNSLIAIQILQKTQSTIDANYKLHDIYSLPTIRQMASDIMCNH